MESSEIEELLPFYALDALTDEERKLVELYLREHPDARQELEELSKTADVLPLSVPAIEPSPDTKNALMARVNADARAKSSRQSQPSRREIRFETFFRIFTLAGAVLAIIWVIFLNVQVRNLQDQVSHLNDALVAQSKSLSQINEKLSHATPSSVITVALKGTNFRPQAQGQLIGDPNNQSAVLVVDGLAQLEAGKTYQVWFIKGQTPVSAGLLSIDAKGQGVLIVTADAPINSFSALGISIEPDGGSQQPTGNIVVLNDL
jgi:anti-sigma-K factor RskA